MASAIAADLGSNPLSHTIYHRSKPHSTVCLLPAVRSAPAVRRSHLLHIR